MIRTGGPKAESSPGPGERVRERFREEFDRMVGPREGDALLLALSGGLDSLVLLHLLRFDPGLPRRPVTAAHFDHRMREGSEDDARWVRGLCRAWAVPLILGRAPAPPGGEEEARRMRYEFLLRAREEVGARWLLTAHHADDQAETILFRILRGTGLKGLAGIPRRRNPGILRPLLPFSRDELEAYARSRGIRPREDPSNEDISIPRNYLRRVGLPALEGEVAPGARRSLLRLARLARENEEAWDSLLPALLQGLVEVGDRGVFVVRSAFLAYHPSLRGRLLREVLRRRGLNLDEAGTRALLEFTRTGASGRAFPLPGGYRFLREFDRFLLFEDGEPGEDQQLLLPGPEEGSGRATVGGRTYRVSWGTGVAPERGLRASFSVGALTFPLRVRGWAPGDRVRLPGGTRKLKRLFRDSGIPVGERNRIPLLVAASGDVLWVMGVAVSDRARPGEADSPLFVGIEDVHES